MKIECAICGDSNRKNLVLIEAENRLICGCCLKDLYLDLKRKAEPTKELCLDEKTIESLGYLGNYVSKMTFDVNDLLAFHSGIAFLLKCSEIAYKNYTKIEEK